MFEKAKTFIVDKAVKIKSKALPASVVVAATVAATAPVAFAAEEGGGGGGNSVLADVTTNSTSFLSMVTSIGETCMSNPICVAFLTVTFVSLGVRCLRKVIGAFGRGR